MADSTAAIVIINIDAICPKLLSRKYVANKNDKMMDRSIISKHTKIKIILDLFIEIPKRLKINNNKGKVQNCISITLTLVLLLVIHKQAPKLVLLKK